MKTKSDIKILAIETSCDETAAAVISSRHPEQSEGSRDSLIPQNDTPIVLSNIVASQIDLHAKTGGVVPEVASRAHMEAILPVIEEALLQANLKFKIQNLELNENCKLPEGSADSGKIEKLLGDITHIAVTAGPGLIGSLLVGFNTAKALAYSLGLPIIPINHIEGHIYSAISGENPNDKFLISNEIPNPNSQNKKPMDYGLRTTEFPLISLTVSGGHTSLTLVKDHGVYENLGSTLDDAAGEAFDKVAKLLDLGYPGGPAVSKLANEFRRTKSRKLKALPAGRQVESGSIVFPRPILNDGTFNFSFSGLKTAVLTEVIKLTDNRTKKLSRSQVEEICAAFEDATVDVLTTKTMRAVGKFKPAGVILAGGVAANRRLREELTKKVDEYNEKADKKERINLYIPPVELTGDNAAMIGLAAFFHISKGDVKSWNEIEVDSNMKL